MVRHYTNRGERAQWSEDAMHAAVIAVKNGMSLKRAAIQHAVPRSTLRRKIHLDQLGQPITKSLGHRTVLSNTQHAQLVHLLLDLESKLFGLTVADLRPLVFSFCEANRIPHPFNIEAKMAGEDWASGFSKRNPTLAVRKPEGTSIFRAAGFNREKVNRFYDVIESVMFRDGIQVVPDQNVYNVDESGYTICQKPQKIVAKKGKRAVGTLLSAEKGKTVTAVCCISGAGSFVPPMFVYPRVRMRPDFLDKAPNGAIGAANPSGWINEELFSKWFDHFIHWSQPKHRPQPVVLIMDGHCSHTKNLDVISKARDNNVILVSLPSHCTHKLQPLDIAFFKSMNSYYDQEVQAWLRRHPGRVVSEWQIAEIFSAAYGKAATVQNACNGFRKAGIIPFRRDLFTDEDFAASAITDVPLETPSQPSDSAINKPVTAGRPKCLLQF